MPKTKATQAYAAGAETLGCSGSIPRDRLRTVPAKGLAVIPEEQREAEQPELDSRPLAGKTSPGWAREARLREQYAAEYPGITPAVWMPVAELTAKLMERVRAGRREGRHTRTFDPTHFEFRGGSTDPRPRAARTRSTDPKL